MVTIFKSSIVLDLSVEAIVALIYERHEALYVQDWIDKNKKSVMLSNPFVADGCYVAVPQDSDSLDDDLELLSDEDFTERAGDASTVHDDGENAGSLRRSSRKRKAREDDDFDFDDFNDDDD